MHSTQNCGQCDDQPSLLKIERVAHFTCYDRQYFSFVTKLFAYRNLSLYRKQWSYGLSLFTINLIDIIAGGYIEISGFELLAEFGRKHFCRPKFGQNIFMNDVVYTVCNRINNGFIANFFPSDTPSITVYNKVQKNYVLTQKILLNKSLICSITH
ncbi:hypothetical protein BDA99DRAFT_541605 [Phascolomyces articulosus]|uniref:Uncharacterized protein n=1 Tax=Phascolomyces articulosus TaxID=60185 RepID=A0AAD5K1Q7_9FUNG|nr:hypothetical protein BDA99DRAFT_541605 [Phascolomyces articulosus]